jgi:hypothetical protein
MDFVLVIIFVCLLIAAWAIFSYPAAVTIIGDRTANLDLCLAWMACSSEGCFVPLLLRHGTSVYTVLSKGPAKKSHLYTYRARTFSPIHCNQKQHNQLSSHAKNEAHGPHRSPVSYWLIFPIQTHSKLFSLLWSQPFWDHDFNNLSLQ